MACWAWEVAAGKFLGALWEELCKLSQLWALQGARGVSEAIIAIKHTSFCNYSINSFSNIQVFESDIDFVL